MTTLRFTENQVSECGYDFSEIPDVTTIVCNVWRRTYWDSESDQLVTVLKIERVK